MFGRALFSCISPHGGGLWRLGPKTAGRKGLVKPQQSDGIFLVQDKGDISGNVELLYGSKKKPVSSEDQFNQGGGGNFLNRIGRMVPWTWPS